MRKTGNTFHGETTSDQPGYVLFYASTQELGVMSALVTIYNDRIVCNAGNGNIETGGQSSDTDRGAHIIFDVSRTPFVE